MCNSFPRVERVVNVLPQLQTTLISWYSGWMFDFMLDLPNSGGSGKARHNIACDAARQAPAHGVKTGPAAQQTAQGAGRRPSARVSGPSMARRALIAPQQSPEEQH